jgi:hypothetical protein
VEGDNEKKSIKGQERGTRKDDYTVRKEGLKVRRREDWDGRGGTI